MQQNNNKSKRQKKNKFINNSISQISNCHLNRTETDDLVCVVPNLRRLHNYSLKVDISNALNSITQEFHCDVDRSGKIFLKKEFQ